MTMILPAGTHIGHVHLRALDLDKIREFYVGLLGFKVKSEMPGAIFLAAGDYHHHLAFNTWQTDPRATRNHRAPGLFHIAINLPTEAALAEAISRLEAAGYPIDGASDHGTHLAVYLSDPEGNGLELAWDRPEAEWPRDADGNIQFVSAPFAFRAWAQAQG